MCLYVMFCLKHMPNMSGNIKNIIYCLWNPLKSVFGTQGKTKHVGAAFSGELPAFFSSALFIKSFVYLWKNLKGKRFQYISSQNKYN